MSQDCLFCKIVSAEIKADIIHQDDKTVAFADINPQAPFHVLVIPKKHIVSLAESSPEDDQLLAACLAVTRQLAKEHGLENGFRVINNCGRDGGQTVFHIHFHLMGKRRLKWPPG